ncbi:serine hydrolase [Glaciihabitans sp. dw_435]|uniref:serine hydrolase n=1 Tax=Glaciihabitans sp. dw_435 TaxID=2720081 RepID=UPI001BD20941|nr:serine hydrolase [Glaciihabitans sp. dw_435]
MADVERARGRRSRALEPRLSRHGALGGGENFAATFRELGALAYAGATVSANVIDLRTSRVLVGIDDRIVLPTGGIGKILLLIEVAARLTSREFSAYAILDKSPADVAGGAGIWQYLQAPSLPVADLAALVGATDDNLATNALLRHVGLDAVRARAESLGLARTALLDRARDVRGPDDAPQVSVGSTAELAWLVGALARGEVVDVTTSERVIGWLSLNSDTSLVASAFGMDPLAHETTDHNSLLINKTGSGAGIRAEVGAFRGIRSSVAYSVTVQFSDDELAMRMAVLDAMRTIGLDILEYVH